MTSVLDSTEQYMSIKPKSVIKQWAAKATSTEVGQAHYYEVSTDLAPV